jgi:hypothetical protein
MLGLLGDHRRRSDGETQSDERQRHLSSSSDTDIENDIRYRVKMIRQSSKGTVLMRAESSPVLPFQGTGI